MHNTNSLLHCLENLHSQIYTTLLETFNLQDGPQGKIRERIFGAKTCRSEEKPKDESNNKSHKPHSHTQKFLAKIMGKATSMDSLSPRKDLKTIDEGGGGMMLKNKAMSQSTSDIFRYEFLIADEGEKFRFILVENISLRNSILDPTRLRWQSSDVPR